MRVYLTFDEAYDAATSKTDEEKKDRRQYLRKQDEERTSKMEEATTKIRQFHYV